MLSDKPFERMTVKDICECSQTSRMTFYTHYADKFELADEIFRDMADDASDYYHELQRENNPSGDSIQSYCNMLDCMLNLYITHEQFLRHATPTENPYLNYAFSRYIRIYVEHRIERESKALVPKYSYNKITSFMTGGMWAFIEAGVAEKNDFAQIRAEVTTLLRELMENEILTIRSTEKK